MRLTSQDKLALTLTSYVSVRALARDLGVSHQKIGRWLREGQRDESGARIGVVQIPTYAAESINAVFAIHSDLAKQQARIDKLPYNKNAPIFTERKLMRNGNKGERAVADNTQFIRPDLRIETMVSATKSGKYLQASVSSRIDLKRYFKERALDLAMQRGYRTDKYRIKQLSDAMLDSFIRKEAAQKNRIIDKGEPFHLFTQYENISAARSSYPLEAALGIEDKLRKKHEPSTGGPNTALAESFLFQLMPHSKLQPPHNESNTQKPAPAKPRRQRAASRRHIRGAGPK